MMQNWGVLLITCAGLMACGETRVSAPDWADGSAWDVAEVAALPVNADPYVGALQTGYLKLAKQELAQYDWVDGAKYLSKSAQAAEGVRVPPVDPADYGLDRPAEDPLIEGGMRLKAYIASRGPMLRAARQIGEAQVHHDCWIEQLEEGHQTDDIQNCKELFEGTMQLVIDLAELPDNMAVVLPKNGVVGGIELAHQSGNTVTLDQAFAAAGVGDDVGDLPVHEDEIKEAFAAALGSAPPPPVIFEIYFDFNSTRITDLAHNTIIAAAKEAHKRPGSEVLISGHADAVGDTVANSLISHARSARVAKAMHDELPEGHKVEISHKGHGEKKLAVPTARQEEKNRRVVLLVR